MIQLMILVSVSTFPPVFVSSAKAKECSPRRTHPKNTENINLNDLNKRQAHIIELLVCLKMYNHCHSRASGNLWIPAYAGMTNILFIHEPTEELLNAFIQKNVAFVDGLFQNDPFQRRAARKRDVQLPV